MIVAGGARISVCRCALVQAESLLLAEQLEHVLLVGTIVFGAGERVARKCFGGEASRELCHLLEIGILAGDEACAPKLADMKRSVRALLTSSNTSRCTTSFAVAATRRSEI